MLGTCFRNLLSRCPHALDPGNRAELEHRLREAENRNKALEIQLAAQPTMSADDTATATSQEVSRAGAGPARRIFAREDAT